MIPLMKNENGSIIVLAALIIPVLILFAAMSIDISYILTARNQLQGAVDASALAAASGLTVNQTTARTRAISISNANQILQVPVALQSSEVTFPSYNTVTIAARRTIPLFFARFAGINTVSVSATATAMCGNRDIMLVFDKSLSMAQDPVPVQHPPLPPQPITATKNAAYYLVDQIQANTLAVDRIGLVSYSDNATLDKSLARDFAQIKNVISTYTVIGWTNIGDGIKTAMNHLNSSSPDRTKKTIILLTDGMANKPGTGYPEDAGAKSYALTQATNCKNSSIKIYTISLGNETNPTFLRQIATLTNGKYYYSPTPAELYAIFQEIAKRIPARLIS
jgi:hypothetical protein